MTSIFKILIFTLFFGLWTSPLIAQIDVLANRTFDFTKEGERVVLPHYSSHDISQVHEIITRAIIVVHGTNRNADDYFDNMRSALSQRPDQEEYTLVVAPQFLTEADVDDFDLDSDYPYWSSDGWKVGSNSKNENSNPRSIRIPSYEILDSLIWRIAHNFPNLEELVFTGHSAGGQLTNRYTASSPIFELLCQDLNIASKSIIANPGSYVYMSPLRRIPGTADQFDTPSGCPEYNDYSYGLNDLYTYHRRAGIEQIKDWYGSREVVYLNGEKDNDPDASTLPSSCRAMLQGEHRLERGITYFNHIIDTYGEDIKELHSMHIVPGVGHSNFDMYHSEIGLTALFDDAPIISCAGQTTPVDEVYSNDDIVIYPNPATDYIFVHFNDRKTKLEQLAIIDHNGRQIGRLENLTPGKQIDISKFQMGSYFLKVKTSSGVIVKRFTKLY